MRLCSYSNPSELKRAKVGPSKNTNSHLFNLYKFQALSGEKHVVWEDSFEFAQVIWSSE